MNEENTGGAQTCVVSIEDWATYVDRKEVKKPSWFRFDYQTIEDSDFITFTSTEFKAWIYILSQATKRNTPAVRLSFEHAERVCKIDRDSLISAIEKLEDIGLITVDGTIPLRARHTDGTHAVRESYACGQITGATGRDLTERDGTEPDASAGQAHAPRSAHVGAIEDGEARTPRKPPREKGPAKTAAIWDEFRGAYETRYGVPPEDNAKIRGQMSRFIDQVGAEKAPLIAAFFVTHNDAFYVRKGHDFGLCLQDAQKLALEWQTGQQVTGSGARAIERRAQNANAFGRLLQKGQVGNA